jgi:hypothetical protein
VSCLGVQGIRPALPANSSPVPLVRTGFGSYYGGRLRADRPKCRSQKHAERAAWRSTRGPAARAGTAVPWANAIGCAAVHAGQVGPIRSSSPAPSYRVERLRYGGVLSGPKAGCLASQLRGKLGLRTHAMYVYDRAWNQSNTLLDYPDCTKNCRKGAVGLEDSCACPKASRGVVG